VKKRSKWLSRNVAWYSTERVKAIAYSTKACSDMIKVVAEDTGTYTPLELIGKFIDGTEEHCVLMAYINKNLGDERLVLQ